MVGLAMPVLVQHVVCLEVEETFFIYLFAGFLEIFGIGANLDAPPVASFWGPPFRLVQFYSPICPVYSFVM